MSEARGKRKLAAILSADVAGYSRLMEDDEAATVATLTGYREIFADHINRHNGRVVDSPGDNLLAEFPSPVEAVSGAAEIQQDLNRRNRQLADHRRMDFRIGINLGDVLEQNGALFGDGVNVAARLEALAEAGGICISGTVFDHVKTKLALDFDFFGEQQVKNISEPVRAYRVVMEGQASPTKPATSGKSHKGFMASAAVAVILISGLIIWQVVDWASPNQVSKDQVFVIAPGPSIAVLPFDNMSGDPEQEYFSDGLTEDIITELARFPRIRVLARNTTFQYKGKAVDVQAVGRELGVAYVLEGGVRRSANQIRITAQLIDIADGSHLWAERYDRELTDIFEVQDEITGRIVATLAAGYGVIERVGQKIAAIKDPNQLEAYDLVLRARGYYNEWRPEAYARSKVLLEKAIEMDADNVPAHIELAWWTMIGWVTRFEESATPPAKIKAAAIRAAELAPSDAYAHMVAAFGYFFDRQLDLFEREAEKAFGLAPNNPQIVAALGALFTFSGQIERGESLVKKAFDYNPTAAGGWYHSAMFYVHYLRGEYQRAVDIIRQHPLQHLCETALKYVAAYGRIGETSKAEEYWQQCVRSEGGWSIEQTRDFWHIWNFREEHLGDLMLGIRKGLKENPDASLTN